MQSDWILDVLRDLKAFAKLNGLSALAEQLDDAESVAMAEISVLQARTGRQTHGTDPHIGSDPRSAGADALA